MLEAKFRRGVVFRKIVEAMKDLVNHCNMACTPTGMSVQAMDPAMIALIHLELFDDGFERYRCEHPCALGLSIEHLAKVLKIGDAEDSLVLRSQEGTDSLHLIFSDDNSSRACDFTVKLLDIDSDQIDFDRKNYDVNLTMSASECQRMFRDMQSLGETVSISATSNSIKFSVNGDSSQGSIRLYPTQSLDGDDAKQIELNVKNKVNASFALKYLVSFTKVALAKNVKIGLSSKLPIQVRYDIEELGSLTFYLAPKIMDDDQDEVESEAEENLEPEVNRTKEEAKEEIQESDQGDMEEEVSFSD